MDKAHTNGQAVTHIKVIGILIIDMVVEECNGQTEDIMKEIGSLIKCMVVESLLIQMAKFNKGDLKKTFTWDQCQCLQISLSNKFKRN